MDLNDRLKRLERSVIEPTPATQYDEGCICFPANEELFRNKDEQRAAEEFPCPLHGCRISDGALEIHKASWMENAEDRPGCSAQYRKAALASRAYLEGYR